MKEKDETYENAIYTELPNHGQKSLKITTDSINYKGNLKYFGESLTLQARQMNLDTSFIQVPEGILSLKS